MDFILMAKEHLNTSDTLLVYGLKISYMIFDAWMGFPFGSASKESARNVSHCFTFPKDIMKMTEISRCDF